MKLLTSLIIIFSFTFAAHSQRTSPASTAELAEITERGRLLASYDVAAWYATDAVVALSPPKDSFERYIAQNSKTGWIVAFGKLSPNRDKFLIVYEATQGATPKEFTVKKFDPAKGDSGFFLFAARALDVATKEFGSANRPYNVAILPAKANQMYVYLVPAQTQQGVFPLGGDVRYLISADGSKIVETHQLHKSIIEFSVPPGQKLVTGYHTAILDDAPEDTDVFHVLAREPSISELVVSNKYVYRIAEDGAITYLMTREAFLKVGKPSN